MVVEVLALQTLCQRRLYHLGTGIWHDTAVRNRTTEGGPVCTGAIVSPCIGGKDLCGFAVHSDGEVVAVHISNLGCVSVYEAKKKLFTSITTTAQEA